MKKLITVVILIISLKFSFGQEFEYGKVSKEELAQKVHPIDASANAAILYREEKISFNYTSSQGFTQERAVYERLKIYNKEGYEWATKKVFIYKGGSGKKDKLTAVKAMTYNLTDGKVNKNKLKNEGIFEEDYNEFTEINTLTMPNIQDGAIIETSYSIISPFLSIDDIYFQSFIPINKLEVSVATPQFYGYNKQLNFRALYIPRIQEGKKNRVFRSVTSQRRSGFSNQSTNFNRSKSEYFDNTIKISEENIPAIKNEAFSGNMDNYVAKMGLELSAILNEYGGIDESLSASWEKVTETIYNYESFGDQIKKSKFFIRDIEPLLEGVSNPIQKVSIIFDFVKSKVKWNGNNGYTSRNGIRKAYEEGIGNVGDINLLLIAMLKSQGINANPVLVSTKNNGIPIFPTRNGFNYVICSVEDDNGSLLLDATEFYGAPNILPLRALNWQGRRIEKDGSSAWISLRPSIISTELTSLNVNLNEDLSVEGKVTKSITSHAALSHRNRFATLSQDDYIKEIEKDKEAIVVMNLNVENTKQIMKPVKVSYDYELTDAVDEIGNQLYFTPLLFLADKESPFKLENRNYPLDFNMPQREDYVINIMLPDNYTVDFIPASGIINFKNGEVSYSYKAKQNGQYLRFSITFELKNSLIDPIDYQLFKDFYEKIIEKQAEQVVLKKT